MFKVETEPKFTHDVEAAVPVDGGFEYQTFKVTYRVVPVAVSDHVDLGSIPKSDEFLHKILANMDGLGDADGNPIAYNDAVRDQVLLLPYARIAIIRGYFEGISKGKKGN